MPKEECINHVNNLTAGKPPYMLLLYLSPVDSEDVWEPRSTAWLYAFKIYTAIFAILYYTLGITSIMIAVKRNTHRLKTKTFISIYSCLAVFGISRGLYVSFDPLGIIGWLLEYFPPWIIISRCLKVLGFPSFSAAYILIFITLYKSAEVSPSRHWHQYYRIIIPIVLINYGIALGAEAVANSAPFPALIITIACSATFSIWGIITCKIFIFAGLRLLRRLKNQNQRTLRMSASFDDKKARRQRQKTNVQNSDDLFYNENFRKHYEKISKTVRKITIITYFSAMAGLFYAILNLVALLFMSRLVIENCIGLNGQGDPTLWLALEITISTLEIPLVVIMLYSVTDISCISQCCRIKSKPSPVKPQTPPGSTHSSRAILHHGQSQISFDSGFSISSPSPSTFHLSSTPNYTHEVKYLEVTDLPPVPNYPPPKPSTGNHHQIIDTQSTESLCEKV